MERLRATGLPIVSVTLKPTPLGLNIILPLKRGYLTMFRQILTALEASKASTIFFCEHDVLYPPEHFDFEPPTQDKYYYDINWWSLRLPDGFAVHWDAWRVSGLCADRQLLLQHYRKKVAIVEKYGFNHSMGFEPGAHNTIESVKTRDPQQIPKDVYVDDVLIGEWRSKVPYIDIRGHGANLSDSKWEEKHFRDKRLFNTFQTADYKTIPGWKAEDFEGIVIQ